MSTKAPAKKPTKSAKDALADGAAAIRAAKAAGAPKKPAKAKTPSPKKKPAAANLEVLPPIVEAKGSIEDILSDRVVISPDNCSLSISDVTSVGEFLRIFDEIDATRQKSQFHLGDLLNAGETLPAFGDKFAVVMASTGRPVSTLKGYSQVARLIPPDLRSENPHLDYSIFKEAANIPKLEDKREVLKLASESADKGKPLTVVEFKKKAKKFKKKGKTKPEKDKHKAKADLDLSAPEKELFDDLEDTAANLDRQIEGASFVLEMSPTQTATLREKLERIARFFTQLS